MQEVCWSNAWAQETITRLIPHIFSMYTGSLATRGCPPSLPHVSTRHCCATNVAVSCNPLCIFTAAQRGLSSPAMVHAHSVEMLDFYFVV